MAKSGGGTADLPIFRRPQDFPGTSTRSEPGLGQVVSGRRGLGWAGPGRTGLGRAAKAGLELRFLVRAPEFDLLFAVPPLFGPPQDSLLTHSHKKQKSQKCFYPLLACFLSLLACFHSLLATSKERTLAPSGPPGFFTHSRRPTEDQIRAP